jgi:phosphatidylglycerophosphate synthase
MIILTIAIIVIAVLVAWGVDGLLARRMDERDNSGGYYDPTDDQ